MESYQEPQNFLTEIFEELKNNQNNSKYTSIEVGTVYIGYKTIPIQQLEPKNLEVKDKLNGQHLWEKDLVKNVLSYVQNCSLSLEHNNGFFNTFYQAYINHGDIKITPDEVWMIIALYFSKYVDDNAEKLRKAFVNHEGKIPIVVITQEKSQTQWDEFLEKVIVEIKQKTVKGAAQDIENDFTTTDKFSRFFSTAVVMNSFKKYFDYSRRVGIQNIHMGGVLEDWEKLCTKLKILKKYDVDGQLKLYIRGLLPVLQQFAETYKGNAHLKFWNNIYHQRQNPQQHIYTPKTFANVWLIRFFTTDDQISDQIIDAEQFDVPIKLINEITNTTKNLHLVGGCRGSNIQDNKVYRPHFSFAVVEK